jgi:uncharacterized RDD family membrane protein YckC
VTAQYPPPGGYQVPPQHHQMQQPAYHLPTAPDGRPLADAGKRLLARLLDGLFSVVAFVAAGLVVVLLMWVASAIFGDNSVVLPIIGITGLFVVFFGVLYGYEVELAYRWNGQTPGKRIMKIAIASFDPGVPLRRGQLTYRMLMTQLFNLLTGCFIGYLDVLWCLWDKPYQQCLHDKGPRTVVVRADAVGPR